MSKNKRLDRPRIAGRCKPRAGRPVPACESTSLPVDAPTGDQVKTQPVVCTTQDEEKIRPKKIKSKKIIKTRQMKINSAIEESISETLNQDKGRIDAIEELVDMYCEEYLSRELRKDEGKQGDNNDLPSEDFQLDDELVEWEKFRMEVRSICDMLYGDVRRAHKVNTHKNSLLNKYQLRKWPKWADKANSIINEELASTQSAIPYITRWYHEVYHKNYNSFWQMVPIKNAIYGATLSCLVLIPSLVVGLKLGKKAIKILPAIATFQVGYMLYNKLYTTPTRRQKVEIQKQISDSCVGIDFERPPLHPSAKIDYTNVDWRCQPRYTWVGITTAYSWLWKARSCAHNENRSLLKRQLLAPIESGDVRREAWSLARANFAKSEQWIAVGNFLQSDDSDQERFLARYPVGRRRVLQQAFHENLHAALNTRTKAFVKANEWNMGKKYDKMDPRCISGKSDEYLAHSFPYWIWTKQNLDVFVNTDHTKRYTYAGGMSDVDIGSWLQYQISDGLHIYEGDFSRFDGRNEIEAILAEIELYYGKHIADDVLVAIEAQVNCGGYTAHGIKYSCSGKVCSGTINTSFGNSLRNMMILTYMLLVYKGDWRVIVNGDDNIIATDSPIDLTDAIRRCRNLGHDLDLIYREDVDYTEFCSKRFYPTIEGLVLGPKLGRFFAKTLMPHRSMPEKEVPLHIKQVITGFWNFRGLPALGVLMRQHSIKTGAHSKLEEWQFKRGEFEFDVEALNDFIYKIYGVETWEIDSAAELYDWTKPGQIITDPIFDILNLVDGIYTDDSQQRLLSSSE